MDYISTTITLQLCLQLYPLSLLRPGTYLQRGNFDYATKLVSFRLRQVCMLPMVAELALMVDIIQCPQILHLITHVQ